MSKNHKDRKPTAIQGDEMDAFSKRARGYLHWQPGELKKIKQRANRRFRRAAKQEVRFRSWEQ